LLYAWLRGDTHIKAFKVEQISNLTISHETFSPRYSIELTGSMIPSVARGSARRGRLSSGPNYVFRCPICGREFRHERNRSTLKRHKNIGGYDCLGRRGYLERVE
jgi:hypothetical protein